MKTLKQCLAMLMLLAVGSLVGCSGASKQSPDVSDNIRKSLDQAALKYVSVTQDRDKGVVTLSGNVASDGTRQAPYGAPGLPTSSSPPSEILHSALPRSGWENNPTLVTVCDSPKITLKRPLLTVNPPLPA